MGHAVGRCDLLYRARHFLPDINVYAISNFLTSSLVLDIFFCMKLFAIKFTLRIFVFYLKYFNNIANNTRESKNLCEKCFFMFFFAKQINIFHMQTMQKMSIIYRYIYIYIYIVRQYTTCIYIIHWQSLVKKMQGTRERVQ